ncbi:MAG: class I SAM-dependent methyltransferase [Solirubrobacterales bacterium]
MTGPGGGDASVIWHDVECAAYVADLELWMELAGEQDGPVLDLGCGTGRVGLRLARAGHRVVGLDADANLVEAFNQRAGDLPATARVGNASDFALDAAVGLVLAPMQLLQLLASSDDRIACLRCVAARLPPGGRFAAGIVEGAPTTWTPMQEWSPPLPEARESDGWIHSSLPLETIVDGATIVVRRLRQTVSPDGELGEEVNEIELRVLTAAQLESEAVVAGLRPAARREIPATDAHVGSTVVLLEKEG